MKQRQSPPKKATERRPTVAPATLPREGKTKAQKEAQSIAACRRSGFDGFDLVQILTDLYGWQKVMITSAPGITEHTVVNAWSQTATERKYRSARGST